MMGSIRTRHGGPLGGMPGRLLLAGVALAMVVVAGCSQDGGNGKDDLNAAPVKGVTEVGMGDLKFKPPVIEVASGATVTWSFNDGSVPHNVKGDGFESKTQDSGTFKHTFDAAGTYDYRCTLHSGMKGKVIVT